MSAAQYTIEPLAPADRGWVLEWTAETWHAPQVIVHDQVYLPHQLPGFAARRGGEPVGLITFTIAGRACEIVTLESRLTEQGIGSGLVAAVETAARRAGCRRLWLVTTNDNLGALGFYQRLGFRICRVDSGAVDRARRMKPEIPQVGADNIPLHDELEMEKVL
ncbi:MAG TPA: GNAT family N-acetyltransferase [Anaerolineaceae bacterium]